MNEPTLAQRVRLRVYEHFLEHARPPLVEELMGELLLARQGVDATLEELAAMRGVAMVGGTHRILMAWPFSAIPTPFLVRARNRDYYANCSWDAVAFHSMLGDAPVDIDSFCHHCAEPIHVELRDGRATAIEPPATIVYLALRPSQWWQDIISTCSNTMVFFAGPDHRDASDLCAPNDQAASLTPDQAHGLAVPLYATRLSIDYVRPDASQLKAHFASLGLTGPYWQS